MTRGELKEEIHLITGRRDLDPNLDSWINQVRRVIASRYDLPFYYYETSIQTEEGQALYSFPSNYLRHVAIFVEDKMLKELDPKYWDQLYANALSIDDSTDEPGVYVVRGLKFELHPTPNAVYNITVKYYGLPEDFTSNSDYDELTVFYPETVVWGTVERAAVFIRDPNLFQLASGQFEKELLKMHYSVTKRVEGDKAVRFKTFRDTNFSEFKIRIGRL